MGLFRKHSFLGLQALGFGALSVALLWAELHWEGVRRVRAQLGVIVTPIHYLAHVPVDVVSVVIENLFSKTDLVREKASLKAEVALLQGLLKAQSAIIRDNEELRTLLKAKAYEAQRLSVAEVLTMPSDGAELVINRGDRHGVFVGQAVLDAYGVLGQTVLVEPWTSRVLLITDNRSAIPVQVKRNGIRAIAVGEAETQLLRLEAVTDTADLQVGDTLVTSGLGGRYPFGYPVGWIQSIHHDPGKMFADVLVKPLAHLNRTRFVLLVLPVAAAGGRE